MRMTLRFVSALALAALLTMTFAAATLANISSKTILTTSGGCTETTETDGDPETNCGSAVYGANGFTGVINFDSAPGGLKVVDYICVHTPSTGPFVSYTKGGSYTLTLYDDGGTALGPSATYLVNGGIECTGSENAVVNGTDDGFLIPAGTTDTSLSYSVTIQGVTSATAPADFAEYNSIRNRALDSDGGHADSPSVKPPTTPPGEIPESPLSVLLLATGGAAAAWFVGRRVRIAPSNTLAS